jgi:site-specific DNA-adenine methylase
VRAAAFFYRSAFAFGGKIRNGGFAATLSDRAGCKEINRYRSVLRRMAKLREWWQGTVIEHLDFGELIEAYANRQGALLFCNPPYYGTERHYSRHFPRMDHERLADSLNSKPCAAVVTYYDTPEIRSLYPESRWERLFLDSTNNIQRGCGKKGRVSELVLIRRFRAPSRNFHLNLQRRASGTPSNRSTAITSSFPPRGDEG